MKALVCVMYLYCDLSLSLTGKGVAVKAEATPTTDLLSEVCTASIRFLLPPPSHLHTSPPPVHTLTGSGRISPGIG